MELKTVRLDVPEGVNVILGQSHFIKTVEDIYEALVNSVTEIKFGIGFCESSGKCLVRHDGNDDELRKMAAESALKLSAGHAFIIYIKNAYPLNVLHMVREVPEVCSIYCATANPVEVILAETDQGRGILGVIDGFRSKGIEEEPDIRWRKDLLRRIGYKLF